MPILQALVIATLGWLISIAARLAWRELRARVAAAIYLNFLFKDCFRE